ncbi:MAG TPA: hypothetical protein VLH79_06895 [Chthonomonadales bacterium]|nr:hypothetical protein [Chthonomonadales bacterium]
MASPTSFRKLGLPVTRRTGSAGAQVTGTSGAALATTAVTQSSPYGFATQAQGDLLTTRINTLLVDVAALTTLVNELRTTLVNARLHKGSA